MTNNSGSNFFALLIGIDYYFPNNLPGGGSYPSLAGCVRDINHVEDFLLQKVRISKENILKLTSSTNDLGNGPFETAENLPTYSNMVKAFQTITEKAQQGDQVYIHYSGHGGRTITHIPKIKGPNGLDETLVPTDIGDTNSPYLRDTEMAVIIKRMLEKKLIITMILDSCHSGGATKGNGGAVTRGTDIIDKTPRPQDSAVASIQDLENTWKILSSYSSDITENYNYNTSKSVTKNLQTENSGWIPQIQGYVLLAACRPSESAYEYAFEGNERNGALTYWLLKSLSNLDKDITFKQIHDRVIAKIHSQFPLQTPMLEGDGNRQVFGSNYIKNVYAVNVMRVDNDNNNNNNRILLNAGQVHGIRKGVKFAIYPNGLNDYSKIEERLAIVEVDERGSTNSWAKVLTKFDNRNIEPGSQAILIDPVDIHLKKKVNLVYPTDNSNSALSIKKNHIEAIEILKNSIVENSKDGFLELATLEENNKADFQVTVNDKDEYVIWDPAGNPIPNLNPPLKITDKNSTISIIQRLVHLSKYMNIQQIDNLDVASPLSRKLEIELFGVEGDYDPADKPDLKPLEFQNNIKKVKVGQKMVLRIRNNLPKESNKVLNITILDLQPDWGITQVYPSNPGENFIPIDPDNEQYFPLSVTLPHGYNEGKDLIKVFATLDPTDFHWLELPSLDQKQTLTQNKSIRSSVNMSPLEQLMATITKDKPATRNINPTSTPSKEWTTNQIEIQVET